MNLNITFTITFRDDRDDCQCFFATRRMDGRRAGPPGAQLDSSRVRWGLRPSPASANDRAHFTTPPIDSAPDLPRPFALARLRERGRGPFSAATPLTPSRARLLVVSAPQSRGATDPTVHGAGSDERAAAEPPG